MSLKAHYQKLFENYGNSANAVQYADRLTQIKRFEILFQVAPVVHSVTDIGCGLGHMYEYYRKINPKVDYLGLDFVPEFVNAANEKLANKRCSFEIFDLTKDTIPIKSDYVMLSGVFNNKMENNHDFMLNTLVKMFDSCVCGIAFNAMSTYVDYFDNDLFYVDPRDVFDFCKKNLSSKVVIRNDYLIKEKSVPFEFAVYVYK